MVGECERNEPLEQLYRSRNKETRKISTQKAGGSKMGYKSQNRQVYKKTIWAFVDKRNYWRNFEVF